MAIVKNTFRASRPDGDLSPGSRASASGEEEDDELRTESSASGSEATAAEDEEAEDEDSDADSGMGSDVCDLSELGEAGTEFCQVGNQSCCVPLELYDLPDLRPVLSPESWNELLSEEERLALSEHLPDMDHETFVRTLTDLFSGANFHFGSPLNDLFACLKGGLCEPRVVLSRRATNLLQKHRHYHFLRRYQNSMVGNLFRIRNAWQSCKGYSIEEKLLVLHTMKSQRPLVVQEQGGDVGSETNSESEDSSERFWSKKFKLGRRALHPSKPLLDVLPRGTGAAYKENPKGILKVAVAKSSAKKGYFEAVDRYPSPVKHGLEVKSKTSRPLIALPQVDQVSVYDEDDDNDEIDQSYQTSTQGGWNETLRSTMVRASLLKSGKKQEFSKQYDRKEPGRYAGLPHSVSKNRSSDQAVTIASYGRPAKNMKYSEKEWPYPPKDWNQRAQVDWSDGSQTFRRSKAPGEAIPRDQQDKFDDWSIRGKKLKSGAEFTTGKTKFGSDFKAKSHKMLPSQMGDSYIGSDYRAKTASEKIKSKYGQNGGMGVEYSRSGSMFGQSEETESDSSEEVEENGDVIPVARKSVYPISDVERRKSGAVKSVYDPKKASKLAKKDSEVRSHYVREDTSVHKAEVEPCSSKGKQKGKTNEPGYLLDHSFVKKGQMSDRLKQPVVKVYSSEKKRKGTINPDHPSLQPNYKRDYGSGPVDEDVDLDGGSRLVDAQAQASTFGNRIQVADAYALESDHYHQRAGMPLSVCNSVTKKRKAKLDDVYVEEPDESVYLQYSPMKQIDDPSVTKKKGKKNVDAGAGSLTAGTPDQVVSEKGTADADPETKIQKKPFTLITPTVHTGFSFSIIHLLSAVRKALITPNMEDTPVVGSHLGKDDGKVKVKRDEQNRTLKASNGTDSYDNMDVKPSEHAGQKNLPFLTVQEIVNRVRSNPGDPCILETQEPLQDLVRGVLKIFSSKTAPLGAKGWKVLVSYEKSNKSWSWVGPVSSDNDSVEEETSSEAWGIPHKMLVKLVDAFANWLKNGQETLQQIGSLPAPPTMTPVLDEKERFRDLRAQKSLNTISPSSDEVRAYFRKEEFLRYSIPDRAFSYTAVDGKKSIVAPLRRGGGKPTSKARDHFMLKPDRPPHVTILCLVRDAAARLPGSIGTRADVCTLIRDSQYIVEDVTDAQVNQVVSGALDRLHYERDPCVQFDGERKLWVYLHRDREEEDFEDDGTSSTKKWKRQRKDPTENSDMGAVNDMSYHVAGDPAAGGSSTGYDFNPDLNVDAEEKAELVYNDIRPNVDNVQSYIDSTPSNRSQGNPVSWEVLGMNPLRENKMLCQENSTNEDFDDEAYSRERPIGLLSASLL